MCKAIEDMRNDAMAEGKKKEDLKIAKKLINLGCLSFEEIAEVTDLSLEEVQSLAGEKTL